MCDFCIDTEFVNLLRQVESVIELNLEAVNSVRESSGMSPIDVHSSEDKCFTTNNNQAAADATLLLAWITKGLAMRGIKDLDNWLEKVYAYEQT